jgi:hypothetical protein
MNDEQSAVAVRVFVEFTFALGAPWEQWDQRCASASRPSAALRDLADDFFATTASSA